MTGLTQKWRHSCQSKPQIFIVCEQENRSEKVMLHSGLYSLVHNNIYNQNKRVSELVCVLFLAPTINAWPDACYVSPPGGRELLFKADRGERHGGERERKAASASHAKQDGERTKHFGSGLV